jgi:hypothetical protein
LGEEERSNKLRNCIGVFTLGLFLLSRAAWSGGATTQYTIPADIGKATPRAYIICFGANAFESSDWNLKFAARDAQAVGAAISEGLIPTHKFTEVVPILLVSDHDEQGNITSKAATKGNMRVVLSILSGQTKSDEFESQMRDLAPETVKNCKKLKQVTPDDLVFMFFSTHGYTDKNGIFYLLPYDIGIKRTRSASSDPKHLQDLLDQCISSDDLSNWLRNVDADQMVMVLDTCQSAGSVAPAGYKHGPFGSRGLGQLAYDKGMRVLAASGYDQLEFEPAKYGNGLLTYALVREGLQQNLAVNAGGQLTLAGLLVYSEKRCEELRSTISNGKGRVIANPKNPSDKLEEQQITEARTTTVVLSTEEKQQLNFLRRPTLFDFARGRDVELMAPRATQTAPGK